MTLVDHKEFGFNHTLRSVTQSHISEWVTAHNLVSAQKPDPMMKL